MLRIISLSSLLLMVSVGITAQVKPTPTLTPKPAIKQAPQAQPQIQLGQPAPPPMPKFKRINSKLEYAMIVDKPTTPKAKEGDLIKVHMVTVCNNRILYNSRQANKGKPAEFNVNKASFDGDIINAIIYMTPGDSLICQVDAEHIFSNTKNKMPDFIKKGDKMVYFIKLVSVKTKEQIQKEMNANFQKQMKEQMEKNKVAAEKAKVIDEKLVNNYIEKNRLDVIKTESGLRYSYIQKVEGNAPQQGDTVIMNYTGHLLDGTRFDSNEDTTFGHATPFEFPLGAGKVIKGWDEAITNFPIGTKATLIIPSTLGYGTQAVPGNPKNPKGIPANSVLVFDVEVKGIKPKIDTPTSPTPATEQH